MTQWHVNVAHSATWISADFSGTVQQGLTRAASCIKHLLCSLVCLPKSSIVIKTNLYRIGTERLSLHSQAEANPSVESLVFPVNILNYLPEFWMLWVPLMSTPQVSLQSSGYPFGRCLNKVIKKSRSIYVIQQLKNAAFLVRSLVTEGILQGFTNH